MILVYSVKTFKKRVFLLYTLLPSVCLPIISLYLVYTLLEVFDGKCLLQVDSEMAVVTGAGLFLYLDF